MFWTLLRVLVGCRTTFISVVVVAGLFCSDHLVVSFAVAFTPFLGSVTFWTLTGFAGRSVVGYILRLLHITTCARTCLLDLQRYRLNTRCSTALLYIYSALFNV